MPRRARSNKPRLSCQTARASLASAAGGAAALALALTSAGGAVEAGGGKAAVDADVDGRRGGEGELLSTVRHDGAAGSQLRRPGRAFGLQGGAQAALELEVRAGVVGPVAAATTVGEALPSGLPGRGAAGDTGEVGAM